MAYNIDHFHSQTHQNNYRPIERSSRTVYKCFYCGNDIRDGSTTFVKMNEFINVPVCGECKKDPKHRG